MARGYKTMEVAHDIKTMEGVHSKLVCICVCMALCDYMICVFGKLAKLVLIISLNVSGTSIDKGPS